MSMESAEPVAATPVVQAKRLGIVMIYPGDAERTIRFYTRMLGFTIASEQMLSPGTTLEAGDFQIYVAEGRNISKEKDVRYPAIGFSLIVDGVRASYDKLCEAGVTIIEEYDAPSEYFASFSLADPDGNEISIWGGA